MPRVKIDSSKCTGCRCCEAICSLVHFGELNPLKSRIRICYDPKQRIYLPIISGPFTEAQCTNKTLKVIGGVEIDGCVLCPVASCPSRPFFVEPGTEIPLKCDMCGEPPNPMCVKSCFCGALTLVDYDSSIQFEPNPFRIEELEKENRQLKEALACQIQELMLLKKG